MWLRCKPTLDFASSRLAAVVFYWVSQLGNGGDARLMKQSRYVAWGFQSFGAVRPAGARVDCLVIRQGSDV